MKPQFTSFSVISRSAALIIWVVIVSALPASGIEIIKANNANNLNLTTAWVGGAVPTNNDIAVWNNQILTAAN
jgi:hypothetical protein